MATNSGFAISVALQDNASKGFDAINKRIAALRYAGDRLNKSQAKFGETSGINRVAEGMSTLGDRALGAARSMERLVGPMAALTGAASIAGIAALEKTWSSTGAAISKSADLLNMPAKRLSELDAGAREANSSVESMHGTLSALQKMIHGAFYSQDPDATRIMTTLFGPGSWQDAKGNMVEASALLARLADKVASYKDKATGVKAITSFGGDADLFPFLKDGSAQMDRYIEKGKATGATWTDAMLTDAKKVNDSWVNLSLTAEGAFNRIGDGYSGMAKTVLDLTTDLIKAGESHAVSIDGVKVSYTNLGLGILGTMSTLKAAVAGAPMLARLLGLDLLATPAAAGLGAAAGIGYLATLMPPTSSTTTLLSPFGIGPAGKRQIGLPAEMLSSDSYDEPWYRRVGDWIARQVNGGPQASVPAITVPAITLPRIPTAAAATMQHAHDFFRKKGLSEEVTAGILSNIAAESGFDPARSGDGGSSYGLFQHHAERMRALQARYKTVTPSEDQQLDFAWDELQGRYKSVLDWMNSDPHNAASAGAIFSAGFEAPADSAGEMQRRGQAAPRFVQQSGPVASPPGGVPAATGHIHVDITHKNAPPGTTTKAVASGATSVRLMTGSSFPGL